MRHLLPKLLGLLIATAPLSLRALELPTVFSNHMVLQQGQPLPVWGRADSGATVSVTFGKQSAQATADAAGKWMTTLAPESANATPATLQVRSGDREVLFHDVLVGEVWLCSGQSNMEFKVQEGLNADMVALGEGNPLLRLYNVDRAASTPPRFSATTKWMASTPATIPQYSAVGFHFGSMLRKTLGVPVGLITASWGATPAIAWTRPSVMDKHPLFIEHVAEWEKGMKTFSEHYVVYKAKCEAWNKSKGYPPDAKVDHWTYRDAPKPRPYDPDGSQRPGNLANGMLATIAPFALRGVIWYQGENDTTWVPEKYNERIHLMVDDWRVWWNNPDLAFGVVQLANHSQPVAEPGNDEWATLRNSQRRFVLKDPHAGLAVAIDVGEANAIHPYDKEPVGKRLARWALADIYKKIALRGGPEPVEATFSENVRIRFDSVGSGLWAFNGDPLEGFTLAGADGVFFAAKAVIKGKDVVEVSSPSVPAPRTVRYAWARNPRGANLSNKERLPAGTFALTKSPTAPSPSP